MKIVTENAGSLTLGIREVSSGTAESCFKSCRDMMTDVECSRDTKDPIITKVWSFMSDRCATEGKVNRLFKEMKERTLVEVMQSIDSISEEDYAELADIEDYKCAIHPLLQFSDVCEKEVKVVEKDHCADTLATTSTNRGESMTHTLVRNVGKLLFKDGSGDPLMVRVYLEKCGFCDIPIKKFIGNRFNIYFYNACGVYYLRKHLLEYFSSTKGALNFMQNSIVNMLKDEKVMSICQSLGIVSHKICEPYWRMAEQCPNSLAMNPHYATLVSCLSKWSTDAKGLVDGSDTLFGMEYERESAESRALYCDSEEHIELVQDIVQRFCLGLVEKSKKLFEHHLTGGKYHQPNERQTLKSQTCPTHNIGLERLMAQLDRALQKAPNISQACAESKIMYRDNGVESWLQAKDSDAQDTLITDARQKSRELLKVKKERKAELKAELIAVLEERQKQKEEKERRIQERQIENEQSVQASGGLWQTEADIALNLQKIRLMKDKISAIKNQIKARKTQPRPASLDDSMFAFSRNRKNFSIQELQQNLAHILSVQGEIRADTIAVEDSTVSLIRQDPVKVVGRYIKHKWSDGGVDTWWHGKVLEYIQKRSVFEVSFQPRWLSLSLCNPKSTHVQHSNNIYPYPIPKLTVLLNLQS